MKQAIVWSLVLLVFAGVFGVALLSLREHRQVEGLKETLARHAALGFGASAEDLRLDLPDGLDPERQRKAWAWMDEESPYPGGWGDGDWMWFVEGEADLRERHLEEHERARDFTERIQALLAEGPLCLSSLGCLPADLRCKLPFGDEAPPHPDWIQLTMTARWFFVESLRASDPEPLLDALDALYASLLPVGGYLDPMQVNHVQSFRDRAMILHAWAGTLSASRAEAWLDERPNARTIRADALRASRLRHTVPLARRLVAGARRLTSATAIPKIARDLAYVHWNAKRDVRRELEASTLVESRLRADAMADPLPVLAKWDDDGGYLYHWAPGQLSVHVLCAIELRRRHRLARLGVRILRLARTHGLPKDEVALRKLLGAHARQLDAGPWDVALRYERLSTARFLLGQVAHSCLPPALVESHKDSLTCEATVDPYRAHLALVPPWVAIEIDVLGPPLKDH